jgi:hypothetical protein
MEDNRSTMLLMKKGQLSSGKRTKHFDVRYYYVKDLLERGVLKVEHCLSDQMIADFFTKPIQGTKFQILRDLILNIPSSSAAAQYKSVLGNKRQDWHIVATADENREREVVNRERESSKHTSDRERVRISE